MASLGDRTLIRPDDRLGVREGVARSLRPVPDDARGVWYGLGGLTVFVALMQALTGAYLTLYYVPTSDRAYSSVSYVTNYLHYGWLVRSIHASGAQLMAVFIVVHVVRVYASASYAHPRELTWIAGVLLLVTAMSFVLTGDLLPWDQRAVSSTIFISGLLGQVPVVGHALVRLLTGGAPAGEPMLLRSYVAHVVLLPAAFVGLFLAHLWMARTQDVSQPGAVDRGNDAS